MGKCFCMLSVRVFSFPWWSILHHIFTICDVCLDQSRSFNFNLLLNKFLHDIDGNLNFPWKNEMLSLCWSDIFDHMCNFDLTLWWWHKAKVIKCWRPHTGKSFSNHCSTHLNHLPFDFFIRESHSLNFIFETLIWYTWLFTRELFLDESLLDYCKCSHRLDCWNDDN